MLDKFTTRTRSLISAGITGLLLFLIISPLSKYFIEFITLPTEVHNIKVIQKTHEVDISWSKNTEYSIASYNVYLDNVIVNKDLLNKDVDNYQIYELMNNKNYSLRIEAKDIYGKVSKSSIYVINPSEKNSTNIFNIGSDFNPFNYVIIVTFTIVTLLFILNLWVLFFKINFKTALTIAAFPSITLIPYFILSLSLLLTLNNQITKIVFSLIIAIIYVFITYLLILTSNILNGSLFKKLPLEQAAKASQFIFGLISTYLMLIYIFSSNFPLEIKLLIFLTIVTYFTYASLSTVKSINENQIITRVIAVTLTMGLSIFVMSVWPIESIYAILTIAVIYYILLNVALEIRIKVGRSLWIEYSVLIFLVVLLLLTNAVWGVRGTII